MKPVQLICAAITFILSVIAFGANPKVNPEEPDYTKGEKLTGKYQYWSLGPIGAIGNIWSQRISAPTTNTRMIQIKEVLKGSPAEGVLQTGDVILGLISPSKNKLFTRDPRKTLAEAVTEAEKSSGKIVLNIWRKGKNLQATLKLPVLGAYSRETPWNCTKTQKLIALACESIIKDDYLTFKKGNRQNSIIKCLNALGLLATGDKTHLPIIKKFAKDLEEQTKFKYKTYRTWNLAYINLFFCEYYLQTKDQSTLPIIKALSNHIAQGRSGVGTWSHGMANLNQNSGKPYGMASSYGMMNQVTITCALSLALAQKCGISNEEISKTLKMTANFLNFYTDKGCLPYGDHIPGKFHDNNGSSSQAAVLFNILGDKEATLFFTKMSLASENDRERGHVGPFFSRLWGPLGSACGGKNALIVFSKITQWHTEMERRPNGGSMYQPCLISHDEHGRYLSWDTTGLRLLQYCLPLKQLYITGKGGSAIEEFSQSEAINIAQTAKIITENKTSKELMTYLRHWSPVIRKSAAIALGETGADHVEELINMLADKDPNVRYGACIGLKYAGKGSSKAVQALIEKGLKSDSSTMRYFAINGLMVFPKMTESSLAKASPNAIPELIKLINNDYQDEARTWTRCYATAALFGNAYLRGNAPAGKGLMKKDAWQKLPFKERLAALAKILKVDDGNARSSMSFFYPNLTKQELAILMPDIYAAIKVPAVSGVMFGKDVRSNGLRVLAQNHIKEGIPVGMYFILDEPGHGGYAKRGGGVPAMKYYGQALKEYFPRLEKATIKDRGNVKRAMKDLKKTPAPKLITLKEFIKLYSGINE